MGDEWEWEVLKSKDFGVPQNRERVFVVGHLGGIGRRKVFPIAAAGGENPCRMQEITKGVHRAYRLYDTAGLSCTLMADGGGGGEKTGLYYINDNGRMRIRRLTPKECWRLQGFPDDFFDKAKAAGISDNQLYKQAGNAVTVNVAEAIGKRLKEIVDNAAD